MNRAPNEIDRILVASLQQLSEGCQQCEQRIKEEHMNCVSSFRALSSELSRQFEEQSDALTQQYERVSAQLTILTAQYEAAMKALSRLL